MEIAVGSENPVKVAAVESVLERFDPEVVGVDVDSGVAEQPRSIEETIAGADARARRAFEAAQFEASQFDPNDTQNGRTSTDATDRSYGVGLEGGVARREPAGLWLVMWATVTDGRRLERGAGPSLRLPRVLAERVDDGAELGPLLDDVFETSDVAQRDGAAGLLTAGLTDRETALAQAVACAFGPFLVDDYRSSLGDDYR